MIREKLKVSDYLVRELAPSKIDPTKKVVVDTYIKCPNCRLITNIAEPIHRLPRQCRCGLLYRLQGNALYCTLEESKLIPK